MEINREEFLNDLKKCLPALGKVNNYGLLDCFYFGDGFIHAYNNYISISVKCGIKESFVVDGRLLFKFLSKIINETILIDLLNENSLEIITGKMKSKLKLVNIDKKDSFNITKLIDFICKDRKEEWNKIDENFFNCLSFCLLEDITSIYIDKEGIYSRTYGEMAFSMIKSEIDDVLLNHHQVKDICKFGNLIEYNLTQDFLHFKNEDSTLYVSLRRQSNTYGDTYGINESSKKNLLKFVDEFKDKNEGITISLPNDVLNPLEKSVLFSIADGIVKLNITSKGIEFISKNDKGEFKEIVEFKEEDKKIDDICIFVKSKNILNGLKKGNLFFNIKERKEHDKGHVLMFTNFSNLYYMFAPCKVDGKY